MVIHICPRLKAETSGQEQFAEVSSLILIDLQCYLLYSLHSTAIAEKAVGTRERTEVKRRVNRKISKLTYQENENFPHVINTFIYLVASRDLNSAAYLLSSFWHPSISPCILCQL